MTTNLTAVGAFVLDRLAEDEAAARAATSGPWEQRTYNYRDGSSTWELVHVHDPMLHPANVLKATSEDWPPTPADASHIARHDPARVLAQVAAHRDLVELATSLLDLHGMGDPKVPTDVGGDVLRILASAWADHPTYQSDWRP